ncbi:uncharacterized protein [Pocillopora verrucosa]|uniref:uncharacterized protein isoform X2 n=1 Tax=Pocillopora verrucosa TaxID=203993 RepID=UPI0033423E74
MTERRHKTEIWEYSNDQEVTLPSNPFHVWRVLSFKRLLLKLKVRRFSEKHFSSGMTGFWLVSDDDHHLQGIFQCPRGNFTFQSNFSLVYKEYSSVQEATLPSNPFHGTHK